MRTIPARPSRRAQICSLVFLLSASSSCSPSRSDESASDGAARPALARTIALPISLNSETIRTRVLAVGSDGFTEPVLQAFPIANTEPWALAQVDADKGAQLRLALLHYPNADLVLHRDPETKIVRAGLMSHKTHAFIPGFVVSSPSQIKLYNQTALTSKVAADSESIAKAPLQISTATGTGTQLEVRAGKLEKLSLYAPPKKTKKKWWRLVDVLHHANVQLPAGSTLVVMYQGESNEAVELRISTSALEKHPEATLLKFNRRGHWKLWHLGANNRATSFAFSELKITDA